MNTIIASQLITKHPNHFLSIGESILCPTWMLKPERLELVSSGILFVYFNYQ